MFLGLSGGVSLAALGHEKSLWDPFCESAATSHLVHGGEPDWKAIRREFNLPVTTTYLNHGSAGPPSSRVIRETLRVMQGLSEQACDAYGKYLQEAEQARSKAARFLGCSPEEMILTQNTTEGMNLLAQGLKLEAGDRVLTTTQEHSGGLSCWEYYAKHLGVILDRIALPIPPVSAQEIVDLVEKNLTEKTRVISISHVTWVTGISMPVKEISQLAKANGLLLVVDGAQAPGIKVVNVKQLGCDAYATSAHKGILAPAGTGLLYLSNEAKEAFNLIVLHHGNSVYTGTTGLRNIPGMIGMGAAIDFLSEIGAPEIERRTFFLREAIREGIASIPDIRVVSPLSKDLSSSLLTIELPTHIDCGELYARLWDNYKILVKSFPRNVLNGIRFAPHIYTLEEEIAKLIEILKRELS